MAEKTILVVDDEPAILGLLNTALSTLGYRVLLAGAERCHRGFSQHQRSISCRRM
jgi:CheY-like chemotaxis protein